MRTVGTGLVLACEESPFRFRYRMPGSIWERKDR